jgi:ParB-like chromosome segregation protein Spo0J
MKARGRQEPEREALFVGNVKVPEHRARGLDAAAVARLAESMAQIGLQTPITVRDDGEWPVLVAGLHRLKAAEQLGWEKIEAIYLEGDERDARLWEISENLHRADLSAVERAEHITEWLQLTATRDDPAQGAARSTARAGVDRVSGQSVPKLSVRGRAGEGRPESGIAAASRELGIGRKTALRAVKIATLPQAVRDQAREEHWSQERLLDMARDKDTAEAHRANREADKLIAARRTEDVADWLGKRLAPQDMHTLGEMLSGISAPLSKAILRSTR